MPAVLTGKSSRKAKDEAALALLEAEEAALNLAEGAVPPDGAGDDDDLPPTVVPPKPEPIEPPKPEPKPATPPETVDWKQEAETWKKRKGDADAALAPSQQVAAHERRMREAAEAKLQERDQAIGTLADEVKSLKALIERLTPGASTQGIQNRVEADNNLSPEIQELFDSFPEATQISKATAEMAQKAVLKVLDERLGTLDADREARKKEDEASKAKAHFEAHHSEVSKAHPDVDEIYRDASEVLGNWAEDQSPEYLQAVKNPLSVSPKFFIRILNEFKTSMGKKNGSRKPGNGDMAVPARSVTQPSIDGALEPTDVYLTDQEFRNYTRLMQTAIQKKDFAEQKRLEEGYENTARRKENE